MNETSSRSPARLAPHALVVLLVGLWLLAISGHGAPLWLDRTVAIAALVGALWLILRWVRGAWAAGDSGRVLLVLVAVALLVRLNGIDFELEQRFYADEGYYTKHATEINQGNILVPSFHYPHLLYYLDAFATWVASLFSGAVLALAGAFLEIDSWGLAVRLINRILVALMGALTVVPAFRIGERVGGVAAGALSGALIVLSTLYNSGSHLGICDVPSAFFAALTMLFVARLYDEERLSDYLWAGLCAGLAAGTKYPAGAVAIGIVAVWLRWRWRTRGWSFGLLWSGLTAMATFVATTPALVLVPEVAFGDSRRGILWGLQVHGGEGWIGVTPPSNTLYYLGLLADSWGPLVLIAGLIGWLWLDRESRSRLAWLLPFPLAYLALILTMSTAVTRSLYPVLPLLAVFAGCGAGAIYLRARARTQLAGLTVVALLLAWPVSETLLQSVALTRPGTRVLAGEWIRANVPRGAMVVKEVFTPNLPESEYVVRPLSDRYMGRATEEELQRPEIDLLILSSGAYGRFFEEQRQLPADLEAVQTRYRKIFDDYPLRAWFEPSAVRLGPVVELYGVQRAAVEYAPRRDFSIDYAFVPDRAMLRPESRSIVFSTPEQWCQFKGFFQAGRAGLRVTGEAPAGAGRFEIRDLENQTIAGGELDETLGALFDLPEPGKYFFYLYLPAGSELRRFTVALAGH